MFPMLFLATLNDEIKSIEDNTIKELFNEVLKSVEDFSKNLNKPDALLIFSHNQISGNSISLTKGNSEQYFNIISTLLKEKGYNYTTKDGQEENLFQIYQSQIDYFKDKPTFFLYIPKTFSIQDTLDLGKNLQELRKKKILLIGLGNITNNNNPEFVQTNDNSKIQEFAMEFDSWVRVKLWEFDYFGLRDYNTFGPEGSTLAVQNLDFLLPFYFIYGGLHGNDELFDIFTGFLNSTTSLRSFCLSLPEEIKK